MLFKNITAAAVISLVIVATTAPVIADSIAFTPVAQNNEALLSFSTVSISGRIKTPDNRPIKGASIVLKDADTNAVVHRALSSSFGYYRLDGIETGRLYVLSVTHKSYIFAFPAQLLELEQDRTNLDFVGELNHN